MRDNRLIFHIYDIKWDTDGDKKIFRTLPKEVWYSHVITEEEREDCDLDSLIEDEISNYISDEFSFCHEGFEYETYETYLLKKILALYGKEEEYEVYDDLFGDINAPVIEDKEEEGDYLSLCEFCDALVDIMKQQDGKRKYRTKLSPEERLAFASMFYETMNTMSDECYNSLL